MIPPTTRQADGGPEAGLFRLSLFGVFLVSLYLNLHLPVGGVDLPTPLSHLIAAYYVWLHWRRWSGRVVKLAAALYGVGLVSSFIFAMLVPEGRVELYKGVVNYTVALLGALGIASEIAVLPRPGLARLFGLLSFGVLAGAAAEVALPGLRNFSETLRERLYGAARYEDLRTLELMGVFMRPIFLSSEASVLAIWHAVFTACWVVATRGRTAVLLLAFLAAAAGTYLHRSPSGLLIYGAFAFGLAGDLIVSSVRTGRGMLMAMVAIAALAAGAVGTFVVFGQRLESMASLQDRSFILRFVAPVVLVERIVDEISLTGVGILGIPDVVMPQVYDAMIASGIGEYSFYEAKNLGGGFHQFFMYHGWLSLPALFLLVLLLREWSGRWSLAALSTALATALVLGGYNSLRFFAAVAVLASVLGGVRLRDRTAARPKAKRAPAKAIRSLPVPA